MEIHESAAHGVPVLKLAGRLDGLAAPDLEKKVNEIIARGDERLVFDCSGVEYASSAGLRVFLLAARQLKRCRKRPSRKLPSAPRRVTNSRSSSGSAAWARTSANRLKCNEPIA
ncbi:MAG: STAS domain-containing protein, partial [Chthoniobacterales bacterium]